jgi:capsid protein
MNDIKYYLLFNPQLYSLNRIDLLKEYQNDLLTNNRVTSIKSFFIKYPNFDINIYKKNNPNLEKYSMFDILVNAYQNMNNNCEELNILEKEEQKQ